METLLNESVLILFLMNVLYSLTYYSPPQPRISGHGIIDFLPTCDSTSHFNPGKN